MNAALTGVAEEELYHACMFVLEEDQHDHTSDARTRQHRFRVIAAAERQLGTPRKRGETALLRGLRALAAGLFDDAVEALETARTAYEEHEQSNNKMPRRMCDCWTQLAVAHEHRREYPQAIAALRTALRVFDSWDYGDSMVRRLEVIAKLARLLVHTSDTGAAIDELDAAPDLDLDDIENEFIAPAARAKVRLCAARAEALAAQGEFIRAQASLNNLGLPDDARSRADLMDVRGFVFACSGRYHDALQQYTGAVDAYRSLLEDNRDDKELTATLATCTMNLGAALGATRRHDEALQRYRTAVALFKKLDFDGGKLAECWLNIAVEGLADGDTETAAVALKEVSGLLSGAPELVRVWAGYLTNMGVLLSRSGDHAAAEKYHRDARRLFLDHHLPEWAARSGINIAAARSRLPGFRPETESLVDELIPAVLHLDQMRFQFPSASARQAWRRTIAGGYELAFDLAEGDPLLTAELIENAINSGAHSASAVVGEEDSDLRFQLRIGSLGALTAAPGGVVTGGGGGRLIAGATLPMHPPPRLRMPNGAVALGHFYALAQDTYGGTPYATEEPVDIV